MYGRCPSYFSTILPPNQFSRHKSRNGWYRAFRTNTDYFKNSFIPFWVNEWNKEIGKEIRNAPSISKFKDSLIDLIRLKMRPVYYLHDSHDLKLLMMCLRLRLSHPRVHKLRHIFLDTLNPLCSCGNEIELTTHYLLRCPFYTLARITCYNNIEQTIAFFFLVMKNSVQSKIHLCLNLPFRLSNCLKGLISPYFIWLLLLISDL